MSKSIREMNMEELAAYICSKLQEVGIDTVLSGGSCVEIYSRGRYTSDDIDLIDRYNGGHRKIVDRMKALGFEEYNRYFKHKDTHWFIEFPSGPLGVGDEVVEKVEKRKITTGTLQLLSATDCIKDRLAAYYYWNDRQSLEQALWVAEENSFDMKSIQHWSKKEGQEDKFQEFLGRVTCGN